MRFIRATLAFGGMLLLAACSATAQLQEPPAAQVAAPAVQEIPRPPAAVPVAQVRQPVPPSVSLAEYGVDTVVVITKQRRLYHIDPSGVVRDYPLGVGKPGFTWGKTTAISAMRKWPTWTPPDEMRARQPWLPRKMDGGPGNPLGARALYLGSTLYRIHGTNNPDSVGGEVSSGCFRMTNDDVDDLYQRVRVGTKVVVLK